MKDIVEAWERAAGSKLARAAIHPAGMVSDRAYELSGEEAAIGIVDMLTPLIGLPATVVDFGCGDGRVAIPLSDTFEVVAVDASATMLARLRDRAPWIRVCHADGSDLAALPQPVDAVVALAVLIHHSHADGAAMLTNLAPTVRRGGVLLLGLPLYEQPRERTAWHDITIWTLDQLERITHALELEILQAPVSPGSFDSSSGVGPHHGDVVLLRRR